MFENTSGANGPNCVAAAAAVVIIKCMELKHIMQWMGMQEDEAGCEFQVRET